MAEEETTEAAMYIKLREDVRTLIREELQLALADWDYLYSYPNTSVSAPYYSLADIVHQTYQDSRFMEAVKSVIREAIDPNRIP